MFDLFKKNKKKNAAVKRTPVNELVDDGLPNTKEEFWDRVSLSLDDWIEIAMHPEDYDIEKNAEGINETADERSARYILTRQMAEAGKWQALANAYGSDRFYEKDIYKLSKDPAAIRRYQRGLPELIAERDEARRGGGPRRPGESDADYHCRLIGDELIKDDTDRDRYNTWVYRLGQLYFANDRGYTPVDFTLVPYDLFEKHYAQMGREKFIATYYPILRANQEEGDDETRRLEEKILAEAE